MYSYTLLPLSRSMIGASVTSSWNRQNDTAATCYTPVSETRFPDDLPDTPIIIYLYIICYNYYYT